jgi:hypothetical protein
VAQAHREAEAKLVEVEATFTRDRAAMESKLTDAIVELRLAQDSAKAPSSSGGKDSLALERIAAPTVHISAETMALAMAVEATEVAKALLYTNGSKPANAGEEAAETGADSVPTGGVRANEESTGILPTKSMITEGVAYESELRLAHESKASSVTAFALSGGGDRIAVKTIAESIVQRALAVAETSTLAPLVEATEVVETLLCTKGSNPANADEEKISDTTSSPTGGPDSTRPVAVNMLVGDNGFDASMMAASETGAASSRHIMGQQQDILMSMEGVGVSTDAATLGASSAVIEDSLTNAESFTSRMSCPQEGFISYRTETEEIEENIQPSAVQMTTEECTGSHAVLSTLQAAKCTPSLTVTFPYRASPTDEVAYMTPSPHHSEHVISEVTTKRTDSAQTDHVRENNAASSYATPILPHGVAPLR